MHNKNVMVDVIESMGYDPNTIDQEGYSSAALRDNPHFNRMIAELKYAFMVKEDDITADPTMDKATREQYREYYSMCRLLTDSVVAMLDQKMQLAENNKPEEDEVPAEEMGD